MSNPGLTVAVRYDPASLPAGPRALVVEDDVAIRSLIAHLLRRDGFVVDVAAHGRAALELMGDGEYEIILLDLAMPEMNGMELLEHLRQRRSPALRRIIVMTASLHLLRELPTDELCRVVTKPFAVEDLRSAIADCLPSAAAR